MNCTDREMPEDQDEDQLAQRILQLERRLEEIDRDVRTTHIQLQFAVETFDPDAKKFSNMKNELLKKRIGVEEELSMLKQKKATPLGDPLNSNSSKQEVVKIG